MAGSVENVPHATFLINVKGTVYQCDGNGREKNNAHEILNMLYKTYSDFPFAALILTSVTIEEPR